MIKQMHCTLLFVTSVYQSIIACGLPATLPAFFRITGDEGRMFENSVNGHNKEEVFHFSTAAVCFVHVHTHTHLYSLCHTN